MLAGDGQRVVASNSAAEAKRGDAGVADVFAAVDVTEERKTDRFRGKNASKVLFCVEKISLNNKKRRAAQFFVRACTDRRRQLWPGRCDRRACSCSSWRRSRGRSRSCETRWTPRT